MAKIGFSVPAYKFSRGCEFIHEAYSSSAAALGDKLGQIMMDVEDYEKLVLAGGSVREERDEDGHLLWSQDQLFELDIERIQEAKIALSKAFVIAIYHHWERSVRIWAEVPKGKRYHSDLAQHASDMGFPPRPHLKAVLDLTNVLKHNSSDYAKKLHKSWPQVILGDPTSWRDTTDFYSLVNLSEDELDRVFEVIKMSGPRSGFTIRWEDPG